MPELAGSSDENAFSKAADAENVPLCRVSADGSTRCLNAAGPRNTTHGGILVVQAGSEDHEAIFKAADTRVVVLDISLLIDSWCLRI